MIVYNVQRRWFTEKAAAETYRKAKGLKPNETIAVRVESREDLAALLNALCEPAKANPVEDRVGDLLIIEKAALVDRAYVSPDVSIPDCVPLFLIKDTAQREAQRQRLMAVNHLLPTSPSCKSYTSK